MADYRLNGVDDSMGVTRTSDMAKVPPMDDHPLWIEYQAWKALGNTPDPVFAPEEVNLIDYNQRQSNRIQTLTQAIIDQFEMILSLYQVGRDNGVWVNTDFPEEVRAKALEWRALIDEYNNDAPGA